MQSELVPIASLSLDPANVRKHPEKNIQSIIASLKRFGQQKPIVVDANGIVRAGNGTLMAAQQLGYTEIAIVRSPLKGSEATAYAIADNRTAELAEWDEGSLAEQLAALQIEDEELALATGFDDADIDALLAPDEVIEDEVPEPPEIAITKRGDVWKLGEHRLLCGDSTKAEDVGRLMNGAKADLCFTSPPYANQREYIKGLNLDPEHLSTAIFNAGSLCPLMFVNLGMAWSGGRVVRYWDHYIKKAEQSGQSLIAWNVWHKTGGMSIRDLTAPFTTVHEWIFAFSCDGGEILKTQPNDAAGQVRKATDRGRDGKMSESKSVDISECRRLDSVITVPRVQNQKEHVATFPVDLASTYIQLRSGSVYDPFLGSGTTLIAAEQLNRKCYGMEISPQYCDVIVARWEKLTGKKAQLETV